MKIFDALGANEVDCWSLDYTEDEALALNHYQEFKTEVVSQLECTSPDGCWRLTGSDIDAVLRDPPEEAVAPSI